MRARLTDGTVVTLEKDCSCLTHEGPHWLHMDALWYRANRRLFPISLAFAQEEHARLREKGWQMEHQRIEALLPEEEDAP